MGQQHNELLRAGAIRQAIKDALEVTEGDVGVERLGETLTPIIDIWSRAEWSQLRNEALFCTQTLIVVAGGAGLFGFVQIQNPLNSGRIVVVTDYWGVSTIVTNAQLAITNTVRGATGGDFAIQLDTRFIGAGGAVATIDPVVVSSGTSAAFGTDVPLGRYALPVANTWNKLLLPTIILAPGAGAVLSDGTANDNFGAVFGGYSRPMRPSEL